MSDNDYKRPIGRRRFLKRAASLMLGGVTLAACSNSTPTALPPSLSPKPPTTTKPTTPPTGTAAAPLPTQTAAPVPTGTVAPSATVASTGTPASTATTAPSPTPTFENVKFGVLGDIRTAGPKPPQVAYNIIEQLKGESYDAVLLVGDIINAESNSGAVRVQWQNINAALNSLAPATILPTVGNHETNGLKAVLPQFNEAFPTLPSNGPPGFKGITYSYEVGSVHFVSITSEHPSRFHYLDPEQLDWLEEDLAANKKPYTFVFSHDPAYPVGPHTGSSLDAFPVQRDRFWRILQTHKVTAYICGHEHLYNRSQKGGLTQLVIGTSGSAIYGGYGGEFYHYASFEVTQTGVNAKVFDSGGKLRDSFNLL